MSFFLTKAYKNLIRHLYKKSFPNEYNLARYGIVNIAGFGDNFKEYQLHHNILENFEKLKSGLGEEDKEILNRKHEQFVFLPLKGFRMGKDRFSYFLTEKEQKEKDNWFAELPKIKKQYSFSGTYSPEVFFYHHGLKLLPPSAHNYIKNKIFIDCGAFHGDSCLIMHEYSPHRIYSIELLPSAEKIIYKNLKNNNLDTSKVTFVNSGISNTESTITVTDTKHYNTITNIDTVNGIKVPVRTLDSLFENRKEKIGWIKMDIEGAAYNAIVGAQNLLKEDKPLLTIAIYHTPQEFFEIKPFIENLDLNYRFMIRNLSPVNSHLETTLIGIPNEIK